VIKNGTSDEYGPKSDDQCRNQITDLIFTEAMFLSSRIRLDIHGHSIWITSLC